MIKYKDVPNLSHVRCFNHLINNLLNSINTELEENYNRIKFINKFCKTVARRIKVSRFSDFMTDAFLPSLSKGCYFNISIRNNLLFTK